MRKIDFENWKRREHYEFFMKFDNPFFGIVTEIDCTKAFDVAKENKISFFSSYMHKSMLAVNQVEEFHYRIVDGEVVVFDVIHTGTTIGRADETYGLAFIPYSSEFETFNFSLQSEIEAVQKSSGLRLNNEDIKYDLVRYSTVPWSSFTGLLHPTRNDATESVPKITFGKAFLRDGKRFLPISVEANHALMDGFHIAKYLEQFQFLMNE
ncbi:CatA-like O-acetyltransferase [Flavobacterium chuncheonense]|uniref:CatA-like O-acetyltransferase n=1 Tax=Flavobacterium chuncheonense TaxID=2026653 RepID=A0ABW5YJR8_9FLAO